eukprot:CAMPEP_0204169996 /NCGR_PEP_ID=MMETSP0361-20130328/42016_1 /ASSEMBLY_ACC=CAM_ASM_000343 /TAXON_ID=268821 /ORGANISM="Scrippsiella Hangoei, Strain SHTV-5" /LENGTH=32 /DNA_ID= /DNA_START= /DNA_END= /DNA_ORIENTATION=
MAPILWARPHAARLRKHANRQALLGKTPLQWS